MSYQQEMFAVIKEFSGQASVISIPKAFIDFMGSLDGGLFLSQVLFWSDKGGSGDGWFFKSYKEWKDETSLGEYEVRKQTKRCQTAGFLETKVAKIQGNPTLHFFLKKEQFSVSFLEFLKERNLRNSRKESLETAPSSYTEITTEITTENKEERNAGGVAKARGPETRNATKEEPNTFSSLRKKNGQEINFPAALDTPAFAAAWQSWQQHRREKRKPLTPLSAERQLKAMAAWGEQRAIAAIDYSIRQGWEGIYEERGANGNGKNGNGNGNNGAAWSALTVEQAEEMNRQLNPGLDLGGVMASAGGVT